MPGPDRSGYAVVWANQRPGTDATRGCGGLEVEGRLGDE